MLYQITHENSSTFHFNQIIDDVIEQLAKYQEWNEFCRWRSKGLKLPDLRYRLALHTHHALSTVLHFSNGGLSNTFRGLWQQVEVTCPRGRSGQKVTRGRTTSSSICRKSSKTELWLLLNVFRLPWSSVSPNHRTGPTWLSSLSFSRHWAIALVTLAAFSGERNVTVWRPSVRLSLFSGVNRASGAFFLTFNMARGAYSACLTGAASDEASVHFCPEYYEVRRHGCDGFNIQQCVAH